VRWRQERLVVAGEDHRQRASPLSESRPRRSGRSCRPSTRRRCGRGRCRGDRAARAASVGHVLQPGSRPGPGMPSQKLDHVRDHRAAAAACVARSCWIGRRRGCRSGSPAEPCATSFFAETRRATAAAASPSPMISRDGRVGRLAHVLVVDVQIARTLLCRCGFACVRPLCRSCCARAATSTMKLAK